MFKQLLGQVHEFHNRTSIDCKKGIPASRICCETTAGRDNEGVKPREASSVRCEKHDRDGRPVAIGVGSATCGWVAASVRECVGQAGYAEFQSAQAGPLCSQFSRQFSLAVITVGHVCFNVSSKRIKTPHIFRFACNVRGSVTLPGEKRCNFLGTCTDEWPNVAEVAEALIGDFTGPWNPVRSVFRDRCINLNVGQRVHVSILLRGQGGIDIVVDVSAQR